MSVFKDKEKTKDGRQWRFKAYYHNADGKLVPYTSKRYALEKEAKAEERVFLLNRNNPVKKKFTTVANDYFVDAKTKIRESTWLTYLRIYKRNIEPYFKNKFIDEINVIDIDNWKNVISKDKKVMTCNSYYVVFNEIFKFANRKYELNYNPIVLSGRFKRKVDEVDPNRGKLRYITYEQFCQFIKVVDNPMWHCFFTTLYLTGMRQGEIIALTWNDIDFNGNIILVTKTVSFVTEDKKYKITATKTSLNREIIMSKKLKEELLKYKNKVKAYGDFKNTWFVFGNGAILNTGTIYDIKDRYFKIANLEPITIHEFRHSHVSLCINEFIKSGSNDSTKFFLMMSQRMGHSLRVMQEVYMHLFPSTQDKIVDLLNNL